MPKKYDLAFLFRLLACALLALAPGLYLRDILPVWILPVACSAIIALTVPAERLKIRLLPSLFAFVVALAALYMLLFFLPSFLHVPAIDRFALPFRLGAPVMGGLMAVAFVCTHLYIRMPKWRTVEPLVLIGVFCLFFWPQGNHSITLFPHPFPAALFVCTFVTLLILQMLAQSESGRTAAGLVSALPFLPFLVLAIILVFKGYSALSVSNNGGLIQPTLFRFDFSPYLTLQNEIKLNDNLVLIVHTKEENASTLLRRVYLSGWNPARGFHEAVAPGEEPQLKTVPSSPRKLAHPNFRFRTTADQEYFIVNFDPSSFISMDYPVSVTPYRIWDTRSFNGAYAVTSDITGFIPFELLDSPAPSGNPDEGLGRAALDFYTKIDDQNRARIEPLARSLTEDKETYLDRIIALNTYLRDGDYRYSLKPGTAPDGDQLSYFLFTAKKGYCTYFAFSLCLMLRSVGIPARVAAGFFIQPESGALDYFPVRANMAHAWVEVFFPRYGWIAFDPTTTQIAEGENLSLSANPGGDEFMRLLSEIIDRRGSLTASENTGPEKESGNAVTRFFRELFTASGPAIVVLAFALAFLSFALLRFARHWRAHHSRNPRVRILLYAKFLDCHLARRGKRPARGQNRRKFVAALADPDVDAFFALEQKARFAPVCRFTDAESARSLLDKIRRKPRNRSLFFLAVLVILAPGIAVSQTPGPAPAPEPASPKDMLADATSAIRAENWENAIFLLTEGKRSYPKDPSFPFTLGNLYFDKSLYEPARSELLLALKLGYTDSRIYSILSDTAGFLNRDEEALGYLHTYLGLVPDDLFAWSNFGWLCYKTHRLQEGIDALLAVIGKFGPDGNIYVGLGNLYTAAFNYPDAKKYYTLAIDLAEQRKQLYLLSVYYYNRSILEEIFYAFDAAYADTEESLRASPRSSGFLMQGELDMRRQDFRKALNEYLKAYALDSTPLASFGLADTLLQAGYPEEAKPYIFALRDKKDLSWIANYGTTTDQHLADLHKIQKAFYNSLLNQEKHRFVHSFSTIVPHIWKLAKYSVLAWYHDARYRIQTREVARFYETSPEGLEQNTSQNLYTNSFYYLAFNKWPLVASPYLDRAQRIECGYIFAAKPSYRYERGFLSGNTASLDEAIRTLDPEWERNYLSMTLAERIRRTGYRDTALRNDYITRLYDIHPAAFTDYDIHLPVSVRLVSDAPISSPEARTSAKWASRLRNAIWVTGFVERKDAPFRLEITSRKNGVSVSLVNVNNSRTIYTQTLHIPDRGKPDIPHFVNNFSTNIFRTDLDL